MTAVGVICIRGVLCGCALRGLISDANFRHCLSSVAERQGLTAATRTKADRKLALEIRSQDEAANTEMVVDRSLPV